jgi:hypothetical protein
VHAMPAVEREALLQSVATRLQSTEKEATQLAEHAPPQSVEPLRDIAAAARDVRLQLRGGQQ